MVLADIKQYAILAEKDEEIPIQRLMTSSAQDRNREQNVIQAKLRDNKKRMATVDHAIKQLFEEKLAGNVPDSIFKRLMGDYETEQVQLSSKIAKLEKKLVIAASDESGVAKWIDLIKGCIHLDELDRATAVALINCIEVSEQFSADSQRQQNITIKYNFVGNISENPMDIRVSA